MQFVLILPDGSKSLIPVEWTDFLPNAAPPPTSYFKTLYNGLRLM